VPAFLIIIAIAFLGGYATAESNWRGLAAAALGMFGVIYIYSEKERDDG